MLEFQDDRLGQMTSKSIIHTNLRKPNNKLVSAWLQHFWCINERWAYTDHKTHHGPNLGEATTFPFIVLFVPGHRACTQMLELLQL
jgi:hypothetical protein